MRWFDKNFPDDCGFPDFLFEWTIILFMNGKLKEAEMPALRTFCSNTYLFDKFFDRLGIVVEKYEGSNTEQPDYCTHLQYSCRDDYLSEFSMWLRNIIESEKFIQMSSKFIELRKQLLSEDDVAVRRVLLEQERRLYDEYYE